MALAAWVDTPGNYIPKIYGVAKALSAVKDGDEEVMVAWNERMLAVRHGCAAAIAMLIAHGKLMDGLTETEATDILWMLVSVQNWEQLRHECGWSQDRHIGALKTLTRNTLVSE
jgi:hypothetical protein